MGTDKIQFKKSNSGTPYIEIGYFGKLIFSKITSHKTKGFKYMCYSHTYDDKIPIKNTNGNRKTVSIPTSESYSINMYLERESKKGKKKSVGLPHNTIPGRMKDYLKKTITPLLSEEGYLPYDEVNTLKTKLNGLELSPILDKVQKKRSKRKKKS